MIQQTVVWGKPSCRSHHPGRTQSLNQRHKLIWYAARNQEPQQGVSVMSVEIVVEIRIMGKEFQVRFLHGTRNTLVHECPEIDLPDPYGGVLFKQGVLDGLPSPAVPRTQGRGQ